MGPKRQMPQETVNLQPAQKPGTSRRSGGKTEEIKEDSRDAVTSSATAASPKKRGSTMPENGTPCAHHSCTQPKLWTRSCRMLPQCDRKCIASPRLLGELQVIDFGYFCNFEVFMRQALSTLIDSTVSCKTNLNWKVGIKDGSTAHW